LKIRTSITHAQRWSIQHDGGDVHVHRGHALDEKYSNASRLCPQSESGCFGNVNVSHGSGRQAEANVPNAAVFYISRMKRFVQVKLTQK
jgi:hypothetical protein